jgi:hypothetical protein
LQKKQLHKDQQNAENKINPVNRGNIDVKSLILGNIDWKRVCFLSFCLFCSFQTGSRAQTKPFFARSALVNVRGAAFVAIFRHFALFADFINSNVGRFATCNTGAQLIVKTLLAL